MSGVSQTCNWFTVPATRKTNKRREFLKLRSIEKLMGLSPQREHEQNVEVEDEELWFPR